MRNAVNIFNKINFRVICTLVAVLFVFSFVAPTEAADYSQLINRANELIVKNNLTTQELNELNSLISKAQQVPAEKRTSETKKLLQNYDQNKTKLDQRQAQLEYQDASDSIAQIEHVLKSGEVKDAATAMQLRNEITRLQQTQSSAQIRMDYAPCKNSCLPKCYYKALRECTLCGLFKIAFNTSSKMAYHSINTFSGAVLQVVIIGFAIWIAIKILAFVSSPETKDFKDLAQSLLTQGFIVAIVVILLQSGAMSFFNLALDPIYKTGMNIAQKTISIDDVASGTTAQEKGLENVEDWEFSCSDDPEILTQKTGGALPPSMGNGIICTMTMIQNRAAKIKALGSAAICESWKEKVFIIPHLGYLLTGIGLWVGAMILIIAVPFLMLDAVIELAVAAALLPAAIGAYAFKITRRYVKPVWDTFMNSMFVFMFVSLIALMLTVAFEQILSEATQGSLDTLLESGATEASLQTVLHDMAWWSVAFLKVCFVLILTWTVMSEAKDFAGQFSSSLSNTSIGSAIGTMGMSAGKSAVMKFAGPTAEAAANTSLDIGKSALRGTAHSFRRATLDRRFNRALESGNVYSGGEFGNGGTSYSYKSKSWFRRREVEYVANVAPDGTKTVTRIKKINNTTREVNQTNDYFNIKSREVARRDASGNVMHDAKGNIIYDRKSESIKVNDSEVNRLFTADNTLNEEVYNNIINSAGGDLMKTKVKSALDKQMVKQRMPNLDFNITDHSFETQEVHDLPDGGLEVIETHSDGSQTSIRITKGRNNRVMTEFTKVDRRGRGKRLSSDGVLNRKSTFNTNDGTSRGSIDEDTIANAYSLTSRYKGYFDRKQYNKIDLGNGLYDTAEEAEAINWMRGHHESARASLFEFRK